MLAAKICHDLIGSVGAINNGVELIEDIGDAVLADAIQLIRASGLQTANRLRMFRLAYGRAGSVAGLKWQDLRLAALDYFAASKTRLIWDEAAPLAAHASQNGSGKMVLNLLMLAEEMLSHSGTLVVDQNALQIMLAGLGSDPLPAGLAEGLAGTLSVERVTPRTVHAYMTRCMAQAYGFAIAFYPTHPGEATLSLSLQHEESLG